MTDISKYDDAWFESAANSVITWFWHGIPTLFRCPYDNGSANCDIGPVGRRLGLFG